jgi:hypothetical protein
MTCWPPTWRRCSAARGCSPAAATWTRWRHRRGRAQPGPQETGSDPLELAAGLLDVSLVTVTEGADGEPRVGMLETIREFALERLEQAGDLDDARRRHAEYYAGVAERADEQLRGSGPAHLAALDRLEAEHDNLRAALAWSLQTPAAARVPADRERAATGLRLVQALAYFWYRHGYVPKGGGGWSGPST